MAHRPSLTPLPVFVSKILVEHCHVHLFTYYHGCFCVTMAEMSSCNRICMITKPTIFTFWLCLPVHSHSSRDVQKHLPWNSKFSVAPWLLYLQPLLILQAPNFPV
jgi:hypothetical protein